MYLRLIAAAALALSCSMTMWGRKQKPEPVVMTIAGKDITLGEFEYLYHKNADQQTEPISLDEYVDMFVNYKLKVADAEAAGLDTTAAFVNEFRGYRDEIAAPYLTDVAMLDSMRMAAMSHYATNVDVSHIMFPPNVPEHLVDSVYRSLLDGADFEATAKKLSVDRLTADRGGRLGFISAGRYPYTFEDAAYTTPAGSVSRPFATHAGIHILRVNSVREDIGQIKVRHILKLTRGADPSAVAAKKASIDSVAALLAAGADFKSLASAETEDPSGRSSGGDLPWFGAGMMVPEFEQAAFALAAGETSGVVETPYGYHLIYCEERRNGLPEEDILTQVNSRMDSDGRSALARRRFLDRFRNSTTGLDGADDAAVAAAALEALPSVNTDFRYLINEYRDGMLLYEISNREVWGRPATDSEGLRAFFETNRSDYRFDTPRYKGYVIQAVSDSLASAAHAYLTSVSDSLPATGYALALRNRFGADVRIDRVLASQGDNPVTDHLVWNGPSPQTSGRFTSYLTFGGRIIDAPEEPGDVGATLSTDWQRSLEEAWISRLRSTYTVKINRKLLRQVR